MGKKTYRDRIPEVFGFPTLALGAIDRINILSFNLGFNVESANALSYERLTKYRLSANCETVIALIVN